MVKVGEVVQTPFGEGTVKELRRNEFLTYIVEPTTWKMNAGQKPVFYMNPTDVRRIFRSGDLVTTLYGTGNVLEVRSRDHVVIVKPNTWTLDNNKVPTFYMNENSVELVPKKSSSFEEKFAEVRSIKEEGSSFFKEKEYELARERWSSTIERLNVRKN
jgi:hypothetical protein